MNEQPQRGATESPLERARRRAARRRRAYAVVAAAGVVAVAAGVTTSVLRRHATHARPEAACPRQIRVSDRRVTTLGRRAGGRTPVTVVLQPVERCEGSVYSVTARSVRAHGITIISRPRLAVTQP